MVEVKLQEFKMYLVKFGIEFILLLTGERREVDRREVTAIWEYIRVWGRSFMNSND